jgi:PAS domain S-box-containing protein
VKEHKNDRNAISDENGIYRIAADAANGISTFSAPRVKVSKSEDKFKLLFEQNPLGVFHFDVNGIVTECNDRIIEIWGSSREKFLGFNLLSSLKNKKMKAAVKTCLSGRLACYAGQYLSVTGGRITDLKANYGPILSADGTLIGGVAVIEDISEGEESKDTRVDSGPRSRLLSSQLLAAQARERTQIARELNHCISSPLSDIISGLENALQVARTLQFDPESLRTAIAKMQHVMEESRRITTELHSPRLDELGIVSAIRWFTHRYREDHPDARTKTELTVEEDEIPDHLKSAIFLIVQDYFLEIAARGDRSMIGVALGKSDEAVWLEIEERGLGCDPAASAGENGEKNGLSGIRDRAEVVGARMEVESKEDGGRVLRICWN